MLGTILARRRALGWMIAVLLHALVLAILLRPPPSMPILVDPAIQVELIRPTAAIRPRPPSTPSVAQSQAAPLRAMAAPSSSVSAPASPARALSAPPPIATPQASPASPTGPALGLQGALKASLGCRESANLSPSERRKCEDQLADQLGGGGAGRYGLDPAKRAQFADENREREPFLARAPKNNCVPQLLHKEVGQGSKAAHDWKLRSACAKSF